MGNSGGSCFIKPFYWTIKYLIPLEKVASPREPVQKTVLHLAQQVEEIILCS